MADYTTLTTSAELPRIPSISASQALRAAPSSAPSSLSTSAVPTGLERLDDAIASLGEGVDRGLPRGHVTEIYGPPGVGKTALMMSAAVEALKDGQRVVWIDTGSPIPTPRLKALLTASVTTSNKSDPKEVEAIYEKMETLFSHFRTPSLPHLLALLVRPPPSFPPNGTTLLIIDSISAPFQPYFPHASELKARLAGQSSIPQQTQWLLHRKWNVTSDLANHLVKLAAARRIAVVVLNQTHTRIKGQPRPTLFPALAGGSWESCVYARVVVYRDLAPLGLDDGDQKQEGGLRRVRYAEVMKRGGRVISVRTDENIVAFVIENDGLRELSAHPLSSTSKTSLPPPSSIPLPISVRKRKAEEVADSEGEEDFLDEDGDELNDFGLEDN
ncbi:P-loop containing nucleoside triphosphate hydrolase protein [Talaromyces proteolyticus]|uniref:P-loop containing nucleoside triphosphate hydrolase protein n=1 Tax=Talaromyces proteolyticus TaxID=1131652 RepID=A0AAD4KHV9_9EURO|nr:P-loop containing nucleoside triphosphate hydrolase protein [Talaromyces proteolyticus]KAH8691562.1 P-loop containing nucleoside triphosphate hydrolase protein [Talaromyces proteolyticus]